MDDREPNWTPLERIIPTDQLGYWMWMDTVAVDDHRIEQYKHIETRGHLNIDETGQTWLLRFDPNSEDMTPLLASPIPLDTAMMLALL